MARTPKEVGDAWGRLFGLAVDACQTHHQAHCGCDGVAHQHKQKKDDDPDPFVRPAGDDDGLELTDFVLTRSQRCNPSWTGTKGETRVNYEATTATVFGAPGMHPMPADGPMATQTYTAAAAPNQVAQGVHEVVVSLAQTGTRGLYVGRLRPNTGGTPDVPVLIYLDDVI